VVGGERNRRAGRRWPVRSVRRFQPATAAARRWVRADFTWCRPASPPATTVQPGRPSRGTRWRSAARSRLAFVYGGWG